MTVRQARQLLEQAILVVWEVKDVMESHFAVSSTGDILTMVNRSRVPREGVLPDQSEYFVHGAGYTVTLASGAEIHIDSESSGPRDRMSVHAFRNLLETSHPREKWAVADISAACDDLVSAGLLGCINSNSFTLDRDPRPRKR